MDIKREAIIPKWTITLKDFCGSGALHWHSRTEICYILEGELQFYINGAQIIGKKGDMIVLKSGDIHLLSAITQSSKLYICTFDPTIIYGYYKKLPTIKTFISSDELIDKDISSDVIRLFKSILNESKNQSKYSEIFTQTNILMLFNLLARYFETENDYSSGDVRSFGDFQKALDYIFEHYNEDISLKDLSTILNYSESHVSSMFNKFVGINFKKYLNSIRISKAIELLELENLSTTETAIRCGFNNIRTFNNVFKDITGKTPLEMKKNKKNKKT